MQGACLPVEGLGEIVRSKIKGSKAHLLGLVVKHSDGVQDDS